MNSLLLPDLTMPVMRDYEEDVLRRLRESATRHRLIVLQAETGAGKSIMALDLVVRCFAKGRRALFIARGRKLVDQFSGHLRKCGVPHGILMAGRGTLPELVQVASKDTLTARKNLPPSDLVIIDESHESLSRGWLAIIEHYKDATIIGLTATPARADGRGLGRIYQDLVQAVPPSKLIADGWLVPTRVFAPYRPDLKGIRRGKDGDYNRDDLGKKMDRPGLIGHVVKHWKELGQDRPTLVFGCTVEHATHMAEEFTRAGILCRHIDADTPEDEREESLAMLMDGTIKVVTNVGVLRQGVDLPPVSCGCLVRPTKSFVLYRQMIGRLKRPFPGKNDAIVIDHAGAVYNHGMPDEDVNWTLADEESLNKRREKERKEGKLPTPILCHNCHAMFNPASHCPHCGTPVKKQGTMPIRHRDGKLVEVNGDSGPGTHEDRQRYWHKCLAVMAYRGHSFGAASHMYRSKFGEWPRGLQNMPPIGGMQRKVRDVYPQYVRS